MVPRSFQYFAPTSVDEATGLLRDHPGEAKVLAGGMSLIPLMKLRLASPAYIVDINGVQGLDYVRESTDGSSLEIGSLVRHHVLESSPLVRRRAPLLSEAAGLIGDPQVRNMGTMGGALAHADPSGDMGAAVLALRGKVKVTGPSGERTIAIDDFILDTFTTALREDELITQVSVPCPPPGRSGGAYMKLERKAGDFATVGVGAQLTMGEGDYCASAGVGLTAVGPKNLRARRAEACLEGHRLDKEAIAAASTEAAKECSPSDDPLRGSAAYKREMTGVYTRRALELAFKRARTEAVR